MPLKLFARRSTFNHQPQTTTHERDNPMTNELTEFTGRNAGRIADEIEAERINAEEASERAHFDSADDEMSDAEITAELEAEASPAPVSIPADDADEDAKDDMMRDRDAERAYALEQYGVYGNEVAPDRERVEREVIDSIKLATATAILYDDECSDIYYEESVKAKELGISSERFHELDRIASKESLAERREEYRKDDEDYLNTCRLDAPDREEEGDPRDEYARLDGDYRG